MHSGHFPLWMRTRRAAAQRFLWTAALGAVVCVWVADRSVPAGCAVGCGIGLLGTWLCGWRRGLALALVGMLSSIVLGVRTSTMRAQADVLVRSDAGRAQARALEDAQGGAGGWVVRARITEGPARGATVAWRGRGAVPVAGAQLAAMGWFQFPEPPRNPGEFDRAEWLRRTGCGVEFESQGGTEIQTPNGAARAAAFRHGFQAAIVHGLDPASAAAQVIAAMVVGKRPDDADEMVMAFRKSGTLHAFSVSGLHVAMVGGIGWYAASLAGLTRRRAVLALIPLLFGYAWATGHGAPAVRAACMAALFLGAFVFRRKPDLLQALGAVLLVTLLWDGRLLFQAGVQLSYGVVAAIALGMGPASRVFRRLSDKDPYLPDDERSRCRRAWDGVRGWVASSLAVSLAAAVGSAPLTLLHFGLLTPISLLANLVLLPLVVAILTLALAAAVVFPAAPWAASWINHANAALADASIAAAGAFSAIPGGHIVTARPGSARLIVYDLPYGQGASVLTDADGDALLHDCAGHGGFRGVVLPSLRAQGIVPRTVLLSHPDGSHMGGGYPVWRSLPVREVVVPVAEARSRVLHAWKSAAEEGVKVVRLAADVARLHGPDGSVWHRLHAPFAGRSPAQADDRIAVWRLDWRGWRILFTSDAGFRTERELVEAGADVAADVVVCGQHSSDLSLSEEFLSAVNPRALIARNPLDPPQERHAAPTGSAWQKKGMVWVDPMESGGTTLTVDASGDLVISGFLTPEKPWVIKKR